MVSRDWFWPGLLGLGAVLTLGLGLALGGGMIGLAGLLSTRGPAIANSPPVAPAGLPMLETDQATGMLVDAVQSLVDKGVLAPCSLHEDAMRIDPLLWDMMDAEQKTKIVGAVFFWLEGRAGHGLSSVRILSARNDEPLAVWDGTRHAGLTIIR